jgi:histidine ammonia-lyase
LAALREVVAGPGPDRWLSPDLLAAEGVIADGSLLGAVSSTVGSLGTL